MVKISPKLLWNHSVKPDVPPNMDSNLNRCQSKPQVWTYVSYSVDLYLSATMCTA